MSALGLAIWRRVQFIGNAKASNHEFVDFESANAGAADDQSTNGHGPDGQCANSYRTQCDCGDRLRPDGLRPDGYCWGMSDISTGAG